MEDGGFTLVKKKGRRPAPAKPQQSAAVGGGFRYQRTGAAGAAAADRMASVQKQLDESIAEVARSPLWTALAALLHPLRPIEDVVCLGVGNFASSASARYQLAMALLLRQELLGVAPSGLQPGGGSVAEACLDVYDPVLDETEHELLAARRCRVPTVNEEGRRAARRRTLFFMPHCGRQLYANLLEANWGAQPLGRVVILGNSFAAYADALTASQRERAAAWCRLTRAAPFATEVECGEPAGARSAFANAFNNLALHTFAPPALPPSGDASWEAPFAPPPADDPLVRRDIIPASAGCHEHCCHGHSHDHGHAHGGNDEHSHG